MDDSLPVCIIYLNDDLSIKGYNDYLKQELSSYNLDNYIFNGYINSYIKNFSKDMTRSRSILSVDNVLITCIVSYHKSNLLIEPMLYNKSFIRFISHELKTLVSASIDLLNFLSRTVITHEQKKYIEPMRINNLNLLKTMNNTIDYLKITSGLISISKGDFLLSRAISEIKTNTSSSTFNIKRDVVLTTDYKKFIEMVIHLISNSSNVVVSTYVNEDIFYMEFIIPGEKLSKYQRETLFDGFIHNDTRTDHKSLHLPIAKGLAILIGGDLSFVSNIDKSNVYRFSIKTKDVDSD